MTVLAESRARHLAREAAKRPAAAEACLRRLRAAGEPLPALDLAALNLRLAVPRREPQRLAAVV